MQKLHDQNKPFLTASVYRSCTRLCVLGFKHTIDKEHRCFLDCAIFVIFLTSWNRRVLILGGLVVAVIVVEDWLPEHCLTSDLSAWGGEWWCLITAVEARDFGATETDFDGEEDINPKWKVSKVVLRFCFIPLLFQDPMAPVTVAERKW